MTSSINAIPTFEEKQYVTEKRLNCSHKDVQVINQRMSEMEQQLQNLLFLVELGASHYVAAGCNPAEVAALEASAISLLQNVGAYVDDTRTEVRNTLASVLAARA